jgi:hypothetical protein
MRSGFMKKFSIVYLLVFGLILSMSAQQQNLRFQRDLTSLRMSRLNNINTLSGSVMQNLVSGHTGGLRQFRVRETGMPDVCIRKKILRTNIILNITDIRLSLVIKT